MRGLNPRIFSQNQNQRQRQLQRQRQKHHPGASRHPSEEGNNVKVNTSVTVLMLI
jgi:hypothetical protein